MLGQRLIDMLDGLNPVVMPVVGTSVVLAGLLVQTAFRRRPGSLLLLEPLGLLVAAGLAYLLPGSLLAALMVAFGSLASLGGIFIYGFGFNFSSAAASATSFLLCCSGALKLTSSMPDALDPSNTAIAPLGWAVITAAAFVLFAIFKPVEFMLRKKFDRNGELPFPCL